MLEDARSIDEYYGKKVIFGIIFTILLIIATIPSILVGTLVGSEEPPPPNSMNLHTSLIISSSITGFMLLLQYYPIHRVIFRGIPTRRSLNGDGVALVFLSFLAMMLCVVDIAWSASRVSSSGGGTTTIKNITTAYSIIAIIASVIGAVIDFSFIYIYVRRY